MKKVVGYFLLSAPLAFVVIVAVVGTVIKHGWLIAGAFVGAIVIIVGMMLLGAKLAWED